ncbi:hypothetical protein ACFLU9_02110 [Chloroflexota bacterium]
METEKKVEPDKMMAALEDEFKLIKGELKETLSSVRDYLLNSELPASEYAAILTALGGGIQSTMSGRLSIDKDSFMPEPVQEEIIDEPPPAEPDPESFEPDEPIEPKSSLPQPQAEAPVQPGRPSDKPLEPGSELSQEEDTRQSEPFVSEEDMKQSESFMPESELSQEEDTEQSEPFMPESELLREEDTEQSSQPFISGSGMPEQQIEYRQIDEEGRQSTPPVNLLTNLTHWVANSKKEIGSEQLPTFLEIYGITGHLTPELKDLIMHMAEITSVQTAEPSAAEIWSKLMLELHGILTGGDAPLHPAKPFWNETVDDIQLDDIQPDDTKMEEVRPKDKPLKLKLVLSKGDDEEKEFCIDLSPEESEDSP